MKTAFNDYFEQKVLTDIETREAMDERVGGSRPIACRFNEASASEVELLLNTIQKDYRVYFRENIKSSDVPAASVSPAVPSAGAVSAPIAAPVSSKYSFEINGPLPSELSKFAALYNLGFKTSASSIFLFRSGDLPDDVFRFDRRLEPDELETVASLFPDLNLKQVRNSLFIKGRVDRVLDCLDVLPSVADQEQFVLSLVLLNVDSSKVFDLAAKLNFSSIDLISPGYSLYDVFQAYGNIDLKNNWNRQYFEQQIYLSLGQKASYNFGTEIQREQRAITDQGTSTVNGYQNFKDGIEIEAKIDREEDSLIVDLTFDRSKFTDQTALSRSANSIEYERLRVKPNHLYYLTQFVESDQGAGSEFLRAFQNSSGRSIMVWFAVFPVKEKKSIFSPKTP